MAVERRNEVLAKAVASDTQPIPRYNLVDTYGHVLLANVSLELQNSIVQQGTPVDKQALDECLAASGVTSGTATAFTLVQPGFALFDGALIRFKLHVDSGATPTINVNGTGAKALMATRYKPMPVTFAGTWITAVYSTTFGFFVLQGSNIPKKRFGNDPGQISSYELWMCAGGDPTHYCRPL